MPAPALSVPLKDVMQFFERQFVRLNTLLTKSALLFIAVIAVESCAISAVTYWSIDYFFLPVALRRFLIGHRDSYL